MTWAAVGSLNPNVSGGPSSFSYTPFGTGDLVIMAVNQFNDAVVYATALSSSNATWTPIGFSLGTNISTTTALFAGKITSTANVTVTVTWSGTAPTTNVIITAQEFSSTVGTWFVDASTTLNSAGVASWPTLSPSGTGELYAGYALNVGSAVAGATSGYVYAGDVTGNGYAYNLNVSAPSAPVWGDSGQACGVMALIAEGTPASGSLAASQWPARPRQDRLRHHHGVQRQQFQPVFASSGLTVTAGLAAATGTAAQPVAQVTGADQTGALATAIAYSPVVQVTGADQTGALATAVAYQPVALVAAAAGLASGTGSALSPPAQVTAFDQTGALATGAAYNPVVHFGPVLVSAGAVSQNLAPSFGQATTAGNLLVAWILDNSSVGAVEVISNGVTGWIKGATSTNAFGHVSIWLKFNCGTGETAPQWTSSGSAASTTMLAEFSGTGTAVDQSGFLNGSGPTGTVSNGTSDVAGLELLISCLGTTNASTGFTMSTLATDGTGTSVSLTEYKSNPAANILTDFAWGVTGTAGGSADTASGTITGGFANVEMALLSIQPPGPGLSSGIAQTQVRPGRRFRRRYQRQQVQQAFASAEVDVTVTAGVASATGAASNPVAQVTALPAAAVATGAAQQSVAQVTALPAVALATGAAQQSVAQVTALPAVALATGAAQQPVAQVTALPAVALATGAAQQPVAQVTAFDQTGALATAAAYGAAVTVLNALAAPQQPVRPAWHRRYRRRQQVQSTAPATPGGPPFLTSIAGSGSGQYFADQYAKPWLMRSDTVWGLIAQAGAAGGAVTWQSDMDAYTSARAAEGFTAFLTTPTSSAQLGGAAANGNTWDGVNPFTSPGVLNGTFWARVDYLLASAQAQGLTVILDVLFTYASISGGCLNGWTTGQFQNYGTALATRYSAAPNLVWHFGDDYTQATGSTLIDADLTSCLTGIRGGGDTHLISIENAAESTSRRSLDASATYTWGTANAQYQWCYTYNTGYDAVEIAYQESSPICTCQMDGWYDNQNTLGESTELFMRKLVWWALSSGSRGYQYGNNDLAFWPPNAISSGLVSPSPGSSYMQPAALRAVLDTFAGFSGWHQLVPDTGSALVTAGRGTHATTFVPGGGSGAYTGGNTYVTASITPSGSLAVIYIPAHTTITVNGALMTPGYTASWVDPASGAATSATIGSTYNSTTQGSNSASDPDWLLVLQVPSAVNASPTAGLAAGTGVAYNPVAQVTALPAAALATAVAANPVAQVTALPAAALATAVAANPVAQVTALPAAALATAVAANPVAQVTALPAAALATAVAANPVAQVTALPAAALAAGNAYQPAISYTPAAALATGVASQPVAQVTALSAAAFATGTAYNPSVTTGGDANANPSAALATAVAQQPVAQVTALPSAALAAGTAYLPAAGRTVASAAATGTAQQPLIQLTVLPAPALATGIAQQPAAGAAVPAGLATATSAAYNVAPGRSPAAALATGTAAQPAIAMVVVAGLAAASGVAGNPVATAAATVVKGYSTGTTVTEQASTVTSVTEAASTSSSVS